MIEGAAEGAGLGIQFLKHLGRTRLLLHLVDVSPYGGSGDPIDDARKIIAELAKYSDELVAKQRWLVLNKIDQMPEDERDTRCHEIVEGLDWQGPVFHISALSGDRYARTDLQDHGVLGSAGRTNLHWHTLTKMNR